MSDLQSDDEWVETDDGVVFRWPFCSVPGCRNRICRNKSDRFCWPHMGSGKTLNQIIREETKVPESVEN